MKLRRRGKRPRSKSTLAFFDLSFDFRSHSNFYEMNFVEEGDRQALLESIKEMAAIIEQADLNAVQTELSSLKSVTLRNVQKGTCKIGNNSYDFNRTAV